MELSAREAETLGGARPVPAALAQDLREGLPLDRAEVGGDRTGRLVGTFASFVGGIAGRPRANGVRAQGALLGLCPLVAVVVGGFWIFSGFVVHTARGAAMTSERGFRYWLRATDGIWRFKHRPVLVAFDLLALVVLVFCAGMAAA